MRPYIAIIKDSFREALASRVLWVLLLLITALLLGLVPFHWRTTIAAEMRSQDVRSIRNLANSLKAADSEDSDEDSDPLTKHVWDSLSQKTQERISSLRDAHGPRAFGARERLVDNFNEIIARDDFYQPEIWGDVELPERAKELQQLGTLAGPELKQFNRLALESALPGQLRPCPDEAVMFRYAKWDMDFVPPLSRKFALEMLDTFVMTFMAVFVGFFGIFAGVLVTAPIIPGMLNSGSLYVLLSKPVSRPLTYIAKFIGGCSFVFINAAYLIAGLCLILGLRFGVWKPQLLWSVPIFLFSFAIFYAVSALSGLVWRSAVMAIVATIIFWFLCKTVATTKDVLEQFVVVPQKITDVVKQGDQMFATRKNGDVVVWNPGLGTFDPIFHKEQSNQGRGPEMMMGATSTLETMIYDEADERLIALDRNWSQADIISGSRTSGWQREVKVPAPRNARGLFQLDGDLIAVADNGVYRVSATPDDKPADTDAPAAEADEKPAGINIFGFKIGAPARKEAEEAEGPDGLLSEDIGQLPGDARVAFDATTRSIWIHGSRELRKFSQTDGIFREVESIDPELKEVTALSANGGIVVLANRSEDTHLVTIMDGENMESRRTIDVQSDDDLNKLSISDDGRWISCLFDNDQLAMYDLQDTNDGAITRFPSQGSISGARFANGTLLIVDSNDRVMELSPDTRQRQSIVAPQLRVVRQLYRYLVRPLYLIFPKPAELQNTMQYAITGKDTVKVEGPGMGPGGRTIKLNPWEPLVSNSIFIGVMLLFGCIYVYRQDF